MKKRCAQEATITHLENKIIVSTHFNKTLLELKALRRKLRQPTQQATKTSRPKTTIEDEPEEPDPNRIPVLDIKNIIEEIRVRPIMIGLDLLQDLDVDGKHTDKINPKLVLDL